MTFREKLIALRAEDNLTQTALARKVGVTRQAVYMWEKGQSYPEAETLLALRGLFGVPIDVLLDDTLSLPATRADAALCRAKAAVKTETATKTKEWEEPSDTALEGETLEKSPDEERFNRNITKTPPKEGEKQNRSELPAKAAEEKSAPLRARIEPPRKGKTGTIFDLVGAFLRKRK